MGAFCFLLRDTNNTRPPLFISARNHLRRCTREEILLIHQLYQDITAQIAVGLENGTVPWIKPWKGTSLLATNIATGNHYNGINIPFLWFAADKRGLPILPQTFSRVITMRLIIG